jgi:uncharacterized iron-regulated protein
MFQLPAQRYLDEYENGELDGPGLLEHSEYETRWGWPFAYYRPQIDHAVLRGADLLALNAPSELTKEVAEHGIRALDEQRRNDLDLHDEQHRALFKQLMHGHPKGRRLKRAYHAQVLWDETMASTASTWLLDTHPARQLIVLAGSAHCHDSAIPSRARRRGEQLTTTNVMPLVQSPGSKQGLAEALAGYAYGFVMSAGGD